MKNVLFVFGTRPEAIKMAPVIHELKEYPELFNVTVCLTGQHKEMLFQVLDFFDLSYDYNLDIMKANQSLNSITASVINELKPVLEKTQPHVVLVHGDTTTTLAASLASFYFGAKIGHVEAGLRTYNKWSPFPEEMNRQLTDKLTDFHFAPTTTSAENLIQEGTSSSSIFITGNTVIDALLMGVKKLKMEGYSGDDILRGVNRDKKIILVTGHRRENHGDGFMSICDAILEISRRKDVHVVYPVHLNPNVKDVVYERLSNQPNISLIEPLDYKEFIWLMNKAHIILTDSGGVQEEAPSLGKPVLVMRDTTERPEAVEAGTVILVGTDRKKIVSELSMLLDNDSKYLSMSNKHNPYGDGKASEKIIKELKIQFGI
ncbi:non-hydrolyzing UDP-N-acetylglucosamine 2-epimerase [Winogradskyella aurantiaca]|uniref:non-hydrolyzing UDP-N-acetylglucosamine 2-epimerase n=1 Tax=Winogradskyella aurantiaca TaxID=2219558 RepID=UPI000E1C5D76|nr:UDP-N-acetylglucosamine 2-epimerase (non-hydrolyzing) [Winogradskyella aurantiaca]